MSDFIKWVQMRLTSHGFPTGLIDGEAGPITTKAIQAFERRHGLPGDGTADERVVRALRLPPLVTPSDVYTIPDRDVDELPLAQPAITPKNVWPTQSSVQAYYGKPGESQTTVEIPFDMFLAWRRSQRIKRMTVHRLVAESVSRALAGTAQRYTALERRSLGLDMFGGSLNVRPMRGGTRMSMHSWGIAIDFDPERNQLKWGAPKARLSHPDAIAFWQEWEKEGWVSLGRARNFDWMHVQAARL